VDAKSGSMKIIKEFLKNKKNLQGKEIHQEKNQEQAEDSFCMKHILHLLLLDPRPNRVRVFCSVCYMWGPK